MSFASLCLLGVAQAALNNRPIIGILSEPTERYGNAITASYAKWIESAGARAAVVDYNSSASEVRRLFGSLNGVVLQGSAIRLQYHHEKYWQTATLLFELTLAAHASGAEPFPIWGTCMGFQTLGILAAGSNTSVLSRAAFDSSDYMADLSMTADTPHTRIFSSMPEGVKQTLTSGNATTNDHIDGITLHTLRSNPKLREFFWAAATSVDRRGQSFISLLEARHGVPIFASQFHPEKSLAEFDENPNDPHTSEEVDASHWLASFFVQQARLSHRAFATCHAEQDSLVYNIAPHFVSKGTPRPTQSDTQVYILPPADQAGLS